MKIIRETKGYIPQNETYFDIGTVWGEPHDIVHISDHTYIIEEYYSPYEGVYHMVLTRKAKKRPWYERIEMYTSDYDTNWSYHSTIFRY